MYCCLIIYQINYVFFKYAFNILKHYKTWFLSRYSKVFQENYHYLYNLRDIYSAKQLSIIFILF